MRCRNPDASARPRRAEGWALSPDVRRLRVARVHALPPRPRSGPRSAAGRAWLARLEALQGPAAWERGGPP